jgi:hypothetical protein
MRTTKDDVSIDHGLSHKDINEAEPLATSFFEN